MFADTLKKPELLDQYAIVKTLGSGYHAEVKLAMDSEGNYVAVKKYKKDTADLKTLRHELNIMRNLNHNNLVKLIDVRQNAIYKRSDESTYDCFAIILEYVGGGELFDFIAQTGKFSQKVTRTYFHQMMSGLHHMHTQGYAHRDIKPENILLTKDFVLKLADFGFSCLIRGKDKSGILRTKLGTEGYMAPEIQQKKYQGSSVDIFAAGVILFIMYAGNPPFERAHPSDPYYKLLKNKNYPTFWTAHARKRSINYFKPQFQDLINKMLAYVPSERITIEEIANHPWVKTQICSHSEIVGEFTGRQKMLNLLLEEKKLEQEKLKQKNMNTINHQGVSCRCELTSSSNEQFFNYYSKEYQISRKIDSYSSEKASELLLKEQSCYFLSVLKQFLNKHSFKIEEEDDPEEFLTEEDDLIRCIEVKDQNQNVLIAKYGYSYGTEEQLLEQWVEVKITIFKSVAHQIHVSFEQESGNYFYYKNIVQRIKNQFLYCQQ